MSVNGIVSSSPCPCCAGRGTIAVEFTKPDPTQVSPEDQRAMTHASERRVSLSEHAHRAGMSPFSFHGKDRRKSMGLVETPGPGGVYLTPESSATHVAETHEKRETRRLNKR